MRSVYRRPQLLFLVLAVFITSAWADKATIAPMARHTLQHDSLEREYFVFLPSMYDGKQELPVAIFLHGYGGTATGTEAEVAQGLNRYAEEYGYVMVYPQGTWFMAGDSVETQWEATSWNHISSAIEEGRDGPICTPDVTTYPCPPGAVPPSIRSAARRQSCATPPRARTEASVAIVSSRANCHQCGFGVSGNSAKAGDRLRMACR